MDGGQDGVLFRPVMRFFWEGDWGAGYVEPRRRIYDCELVFVSAGSYTLDMGGRRRRLRAGAFAVIPPGVWHESRVGLRGRVRRHCVHFDWLPGASERPSPLQSFSDEPFDSRLMGAPPAGLAERLPLVVHAGPRDDVVVLMNLALVHIRKRGTMGGYLLWPVLAALLADAGASAGSAWRGKTARAVLAVRDYIDAHFAEAQGYGTYCGLTGLTPSHICQAFRKLVGRPPTTYLLDLRLHHARRLLRETRANVGEVAYAVGFADPNYFVRMFRRKFGTTPTRFIERRHLHA